jgi:hypothetical protein
MRGREAAPGAQRVRAVGEQLDVREPSAERHEIPGTVDVGHRLEQPDDADREDGGDREVRGRPPQRTPGGAHVRGDPEEQRQHYQHADRPASAGVHQLVDRPAVGADPAHVRGIEE